MRDTDSNIIIAELYPLVKDALDKNSNRFMKNIETFINSRHEELFAIAPYDRILYNEKDKINLFNAIGLTEKQIENILKNTFFWNIDYTPKCAKEPYVEMLMCCIKYYVKNKERKKAELTTIYLCFTGKFYASLHTEFWRKYPPRENQSVMDYVINNMLSDKFDLKKEGTVFGAIKKLACTWLDTYDKKLTSDCTDDMFGKLIQQLRDREKSFLRNIANLYYEAYENKLYLNYETDNLDSDNFRITDNDAALAARITDSTVTVMTSQKVSTQICNICKNENVKAVDLKDIMETILSNKDNIGDLRRVINIIICDFMANFPNERVGGAKFISYSLKAKPNTKSEMLLWQKQTITDWLYESSMQYRNTTRPGTLNNYYKSVLGYIVWTISKVSEKF